MSIAITGHFDGRVIVPDEPIDLPTGQRLVVQIEPTAGTPRGVAGASLLSFAGTIDAGDLSEMTEAVREGCEKVDPDAW